MMKTSASVSTLFVIAVVSGWAFAQDSQDLDKVKRAIEQNRIQAKSLQSSIPSELSDLIVRAMERNPELRRTQAGLDMAQAEFDGALAKVTSQLRELRTRLETQVRTVAETPVHSVSNWEPDSKQELRYAVQISRERLRSLAKTHGEIQELLGGEPGGSSSRASFSSPMGGFAALAQPRIPQPRPDYEEGGSESLREVLENWRFPL